MSLQSDLGECLALAELADEHLDLLAGAADYQELAEGALLTASGEPATGFYVVRRGRFHVEMPGAGGGALLIDSAGPQQIIGWSWLCPPYRWHFDTRASEPGTVVSVDAEATRRRMDDDHDFGYAMLQCFSALAIDRLIHTRLRLLDLYSVPERESR
jgi:CRP-like cAMP-binding protein